MIRAMNAIIWRELLRYFHQRERFFAALVRPLVWLFIFGAGFRFVLGMSIIPPYATYIRYETYILPGLAAMIILFSAMQSALSMVYDREMGSMRLLLIAPLPRSWMLLSKLLAGAIVALVQVYMFFIIAAIFGAITGERGLYLPINGYIAVFPCLILAGLMLGAFGLFISSHIRRLQNFAGVMNFVIFPMFFASTALYPLWRLQENAPWLAKLVSYNPFTYATELIRFAAYSQFNLHAFVWVFASFVIFFLLAIWGYRPRTGRQLKD